MSKKLLVAAVAVLFVVVAGATVMYNALSDSVSKPAANAGRADMSCTVEDAAGNSVALADIASGKPLYLNFWATWCPYCVEEMDEIQALYERFGDRVAFALVDVTFDGGDSVKAAQRYIGAKGYTFPVYFDTSGKAYEAYGVKGLPHNALIGSDQSMTYNASGQLPADELESLIAALP